MSQTLTYRATIYVAGSLEEIKKVCRIFCFNSKPCVCVTVTPTEFIYSGASETGAAIGLINYPRFPMDKEVLWNHATALAEGIIKQTQQRSCTVVADDKTVFISNPNYQHQT